VAPDHPVEVVRGGADSEVPVPAGRGSGGPPEAENLASSAHARERPAFLEAAAPEATSTADYLCSGALGNQGLGDLVQADLELEGNDCR
jgi:hypothetical protein